MLAPFPLIVVCDEVDAAIATQEISSRCSSSLQAHSLLGRSSNNERVPFITTIFQ